MRCADVERLVTEYVDGDLDERRSSALRGHLRVCAACAARVEDEVAVRETAGSLAPLEPPSDMWSAIDAKLAEAEIADARRSRIWLWWQRALDGVRRHPLPVGLCGAAACAVIAVWLVRGGEQSATHPHHQLAEVSPEVKPSTPSAPVESGDPCDTVATHDEQTLCQMQAADRRYLDAIAELTQVIAEERAGWPAAQAARFDAAVAELDRAAGDELKRLAVVPPPPAVAGRDPLYSIYQKKIDLLSRAAVGGSP
jgi:hypothetical protein